jgi:hypothetical protein
MSQALFHTTMSNALDSKTISTIAITKALRIVSQMRELELSARMMPVGCTLIIDLGKYLSKAARLLFSILMGGIVSN